jgi:hypothetical protein
MWGNCIGCHSAFFRCACSIFLLIQKAGINRCPLRVSCETKNNTAIYIRNLVTHASCYVPQKAETFFP